MRIARSSVWTVGMALALGVMGGVAVGAAGAGAAGARAGAKRAVEPPPAAPSRASTPVTLALEQIAAPPKLPEQNAAANLARTLKAEMTALEPRLESGEIAPLAQHAWRRVAFDLLYHGSNAQEQALAIAGFRMADSRKEFDRLTERPLPEEAGGAVVRDALQAFVAQCGGGLHPLPSAGAPEDVLSVHLDALRKAVAQMEARREPGVADSWPALAEAEGGEESQPETAARAHAAARVAVAKATWLLADDRAALEAMLDGPGATSPRLSGAVARALKAGGALTRGEQAWDTARLRAAMRALAQRPTEGAAETLADTLTAAQRVREFDLSRVAQPLRGPAREVQAQAKRSAVKLAPLLEQVVASSNVASDPALSSAVDSQVGAARDLDRLAAAGAWPDRLGAARAGAREAFDRVVRNWAAALAQSHQRVAARANMDAFATQLALFFPVRLETRLRAGDAAAVEAAAGQSQALLAEIDRRRDAWAAAWARGSGGAGADAMLRAARTMEALAAVAALEGRDAVDVKLPRWGGFSAPSSGLGIHPVALAARAKLAAEALLARDDAGVDTHLAALQRDLPVAWLAAQLTDRLRPWLAQREGVMAQLDAVCSGPDRESWLGFERETLMSFSRFAREEAAARSAGETERAEELRQYLTSLARAIGPSLGGAPLALPALQGVQESPAPTPGSRGAPSRGSPIRQ